MPKRRASASAVSQIVEAMPSAVSRPATSRSATCVVATVTRSFGPASIIANSRTPARDARYSVWPGNVKPARAIHCFEIGAVTRAATSPASAAVVAAARYASCARPASSFGLPGGTSPGPSDVTAWIRSAAGAATPATPAARASTPASP